MNGRTGIFSGSVISSTMHRRQILKGVTLGAGGAILSPLLSRIEAEAAGRDTRPLRFVFVLEGNGLMPGHVTPSGVDLKPFEKRDQLEEHPLAGRTFSRSLEPVTEFQDKMTIIQGLSGRVCGKGHSMNFGALGGYNSRGGVTTGAGTAFAETIDAALAKQVGGVLPVVGLGITDRPEQTVIYNCSAWEPGQKLPTICSPELAYNSIFGSVAGGDGQRNFQANQDLLDFMAADIRRTRQSLGAADREKLDSYLAGYESLRDRQKRLVEVRDSLDRDKHGIGHGSGEGEFTADDLYHTIRNYHFKLIAQFMKRLQAVPEGNGTMLDNTLIIYTSDSAESHHGSGVEWPFVLFGDLGGRLKTGRYLSYPGYAKPGHRTFNGLYTSLLHAAGKPAKTFGDPDPMLRDFDQNEG